MRSCAWKDRGDKEGLGADKLDFGIDKILTRSISIVQVVFCETLTTLFVCFVGFCDEIRPAHDVRLPRSRKIPTCTSSAFTQELPFHDNLASIGNRCCILQCGNYLCRCSTIVNARSCRFKVRQAIDWGSVSRYSRWHQSCQQRGRHHIQVVSWRLGYRVCEGVATRTFTLRIV